MSYMEDVADHYRREAQAAAERCDAERDGNPSLESGTFARFLWDEMNRACWAYYRALTVAREAE